jgi:hypothetical protein
LRPIRQPGIEGRLRPIDGAAELKGVMMSEQPPPPLPPANLPPPPYPPPGVYGPSPGYVLRVPSDGQATTALVLGIAGVLCCGIFGPVAYFIGDASVSRIRASAGALGGGAQAQAGRVLGVVGTVELGLAILFVIFTIIANTR